MNRTNQTKKRYCKECGIVFLTYQKEFCSKKCANTFNGRKSIGKFRVDREIRYCEHCRKPFEVLVTSKRKNCTFDCARKSAQKSNLGKLKVKREIRKCLMCTATFEVLVTSKRKYCNNKCQMSDPKQKGNISQTQKKNWKDKEYSKHQSDIHIETYNAHPEKRKSASEKSIEKWSDIEWAEKTISAIREGCNKPESKKKRSAGGFKRFSRPEEHQLARDRSKFYVKRGKDNPNFNPNKTEFKQYQIDCRFKFSFKDFPDKFDVSKIQNMFHPSKNKNGYSRDHMFSIFDGFKHNIDPQIISHPANCRLILHSENSKKSRNSCITLEDLKERIKKWNENNKIQNENSGNGNIP